MGVCLQFRTATAGLDILGRCVFLYLSSLAQTPLAEKVTTLQQPEQRRYWDRKQPQSEFDHTQWNLWGKIISYVREFKPIFSRR